MKLRLILLVLMAGLALPGSAFAKPCDWRLPADEPDDQIVLVGDLDVARGEVVKTAVSVDGQVGIDGEVCEDVVVFGGRTRINGTVRGDVISFSSTPVVVGRRGNVEGDLVYLESESDPPVLLPGARVGGDVREFDGSEIGDEVWNALFVFGVLLIVGIAISSLALGMFLLWLAPRAADAVMGPASDAIGPSIGIGLAVAVGLPIVGVLVLFTVVGIPLGIFLLFCLLPLYVIGGLVADWILGRLILREPRSRYLSFLVGWAILTAASVIPFLGSLVVFAATIYGLGALTVALWRARGGDLPPSEGSFKTPQPHLPPPPVQTPLPPPPGA